MGGLLAWVLFTVSPRETWQILSRLGAGHLATLAIANGLVLLSMGGRWWLILRMQGYVLPYLTLVGYRLAAFGVSYFTPGPQFGGEPLQVYLVKRRHQVPGAAAIAGVSLDKLLELVVNFTFLAGGTVWIAHRQLFPGSANPSILIFAFTLLAGPVIGLVLLGTGRLPLTGLLRGVGRLVRRYPGLVGGSDRLVAYHRFAAVSASSEQQMAQLCQQQPVALVQALLISLLTWGLMIGEYWLALHFLGATLTFDQTIVALTSARLAILFPLPGGLGALEASQVLAMTVLGLEPAVGLSLSLLIRTRDVLFGGAGLWWGGVKSWPLEKKSKNKKGCVSKE